MSKKNFVIADFICPYEESRKIFKPDYLIWMNTIKRGDYQHLIKPFKSLKNLILKLVAKMQSFIQN